MVGSGVSRTKTGVSPAQIATLHKKDPVLWISLYIFHKDFGALFAHISSKMGPADLTFQKKYAIIYM